MNHNLKVKHQKVLKDLFKKGKITEAEYLECLENLRDKKKESLLTKIKKTIMKKLLILT